MRMKMERKNRPVCPARAKEKEVVCSEKKGFNGKLMRF
jgi:hypothetical protein